MVHVYVQYFQLQKNPEPRVFCDALMVAVDNGIHTLYLMLQK